MISSRSTASVPAYIAAESSLADLEPKLLEVREKYVDAPCSSSDIEWIVDGVMLDTALILIDPTFRAVWDGNWL